MVASGPLETGGEAVFLSERRNMPLGKAPRPHLSYGIQSHHMVRAKSPPQVVAWHLSLGNTGWGYPLVPEAKHEATVSPVSNARLFEVLVSV